jgi:MYXO-CTERM domain-containing protein
MTMRNHRTGTPLVLAALAVVALLLLPGRPASADQPEGSTFRQEQSTIGNAGHTATGSSYVNRGTLGQPTPLGPADGTDTTNEPGFWHSPEAGAGDDDTSSDDDSGDDDVSDDDGGEDDDISDDDTSSDDDTGSDDDDTSGRDVCACRHATGPPPVPTGLLILLGLVVFRRVRRP